MASGRINIDKNNSIKKEKEFRSLPLGIQGSLQPIFTNLSPSICVMYHQFVSGRVVLDFFCLGNCILKLGTDLGQIDGHLLTYHPSLRDRVSGKPELQNHWAIGVLGLTPGYFLTPILNTEFWLKVQLNTREHSQGSIKKKKKKTK